MGVCVNGGSQSDVQTAPDKEERYTHDRPGVTLQPEESRRHEERSTELFSMVAPRTNFWTTCRRNFLTLTVQSSISWELEVEDFCLKRKSLFFTLKIKFYRKIVDQDITTSSSNNPTVKGLAREGGGMIETG